MTEQLPPQPDPTPAPQDLETSSPQSPTEPASQSLPQANAMADAADQVRHMAEEIGKAFIGQDHVVSQVLTAFIAGGHVLLEGVPGLGKTLLVRALAQTFGGQFARVQFTPDLMPSDVTGHAMYDPSTSTFNIRKGPAFTNLLLADEINRAPAKTQAALLEVMQEQQITIEGEAHRLTPPFMTLATQNPIEQEGTYPLPEAQLDRFLLKVELTYPEEQEEKAMVGRVTQGKIGDALEVGAVAQVVTPQQVIDLQKIAAGVIVDRAVNAYAVDVVRATRAWQGISIGAGPRGAISLIRVARASALLAGRDHVLPDDIKFAALPALRHRLSLAPELEMEGVGADDVLTNILERVEAPRR